MSKSKKIEELLREAEGEGTLSAQGAQVLQIPDMGERIQAAFGVSVDDVQSSEVLLVTQMPDDSGSIRQSGNEQVVRDGHNLVLESLQRSQQRDSVLAHTRYLNGHVLFPYVPLDGAVKMSAANYRADKGTPLYDQAVVLLGTVLAKSQEFTAAGVPVRTVTLLITDGGDCSSNHATAATVRQLVRDLLAQEHHVVAAMGIHDGSTDFRRVFRDMGIPDRWILTPGNTASEIRRAFQVFSQSAMNVSQGLGALGGFAN